MQLSAEKQPFLLLFSEIWNNIVAQSALFCYFCLAQAPYLEHP